MSTTPLPTPTPPPRWYWRLPYAAVALFVATMAALLWLTHRQDTEEQRTTLINDVLWMEQNLSFQFERNAALLTQLGPELLGKATDDSTDARLKQALDPDTGLVRILWLRDDGKVKGAEPPFTDSHLVGEASGTFPSDATARLARSMGRPTYSDTYAVVDNQAQFEVHVPVFERGRYVGAVVGVYSLNELLQHQIPWWFSERYRVTVTNNLGDEIAAKSKVAPLSTLAYEIPFEPPGHGLSVSVTAYKSEVRWVPLLLMGSLGILAAGRGEDHIPVLEVASGGGAVPLQRRGLSQRRVGDGAAAVGVGDGIGHVAPIVRDRGIARSWFVAAPLHLLLRHRPDEAVVPEVHERHDHRDRPRHRVAGLRPAGAPGQGRLRRRRDPRRSEGRGEAGRLRLGDAGAGLRAAADQCNRAGRKKMFEAVGAHAGSRAIVMTE